MGRTLKQSNASVQSTESKKYTHTYKPHAPLDCTLAPSLHRVVLLCGFTDQPELKRLDQIMLKQSHTAATTFILEAVKQSADKSTIR